jgi:N-acetylglucosaminyl-diphospho-decaprenol L-rhamnosyltransferase
MHTSPPAIAVVIVSFNTRALLADCLRSLQGCALPLRVVVVDNASSDGSAAMVREQFPAVTLLEPGENLGFAGGNNYALRALFSDKETRRQGDKETVSADSLGLTEPLPVSQSPSLAAHASGLDYVLLLNSDTVVQPGAIEALAAFLDEHPRVGMASPRLLNPDGSVQPAAFRFPTLSMELLDLFPPGEALPGRLYGSWWHGRYPQERAEPPAPFPVDHPLGACMLVRTQALAEAGVFDEGFFMYSEEVDLCWRIRAAGWAIWQAPEARVLHYGGASTSQFRQRMFVELYRSRTRFAELHRGPAFRLARRLIVRAGALRLALIAWRDYVRGRLLRDELRARLLAYGDVFKL